MIRPLELKTINDLLGMDFYIPNYQRGYRWTSHQVNDLLNDIWTFASKQKTTPEPSFYCLQPIVVKVKMLGENREICGYEIIDGQQRLTTIFIILKYLKKEFLKVDSLYESFGRELYTFRYHTKPESKEFLNDITDEINYSTIDLYHISSAYSVIKEWFSCKENARDYNDKSKFLNTLLGKNTDDRSVKVIWYERDENVDGIELFTRLNMGKIPLTNSELIKALFLSASSFDYESSDDAVAKKMEISQIWDNIEQSLKETNFWAFITNKKQHEYSTLIELIFDIISQKNENEIDPLYTFLFFLAESKKKSENQKNPLWDLWLIIEQYYLTLLQWYKEKNLYHKIGYLIAIEKNMRELVGLSLTEKKDSFEAKLDEMIRNSINYDIDSLSYINESDQVKIEKILLLFNVESIRSNPGIKEFYAFDFHKSTNWSIEHIHAQNSEDMSKTKKEGWLIWLKYHRITIEELVNNSPFENLDEEMKSLLDEIIKLTPEIITWETFNNLSKRIIKKFSENLQENEEDLHSISNLALISRENNSTLNNAVFEVKRQQIINMDKNGVYIPICTRRVFLKYYNHKPSTQHYYFWGSEDRKNYRLAIDNMLNQYIVKGEME